MLQEQQADSAAASGATVGLVLMLASIALVPAGIALARRLFPGRNVFFARWGFSHVGLAIFFYSLLMLIVGMAAQASSFDLSGPVATIVLSAGLQIATVLLVMGFARRLDPDGVRSLGLRAEGSARAAGVGVFAYALAVPGLVGTMLLSNWMWPALGLDASPQPIVELARGLTGEKLALFFVLAVFVIPLCEELFFRSFLQPLLVQNLGDRGGVAITALLFAGMHANLFALVPIFALALVLGSVMLRTQRVVSCWIVHALHNGLMLSLLVFVPESDRWIGP